MKVRSSRRRAEQQLTLWMQFGKQIQAQQVPGWTNLDYKGLKKIINSLAKGRPADAALLAAGIRPASLGSPRSDDEPQLIAETVHGDAESNLQAHKAAFFFKLERELERINAFYLQKEADLKVRLRSLIDKRKVVQASSAGKLTKDSSSFAALYEGFRHFEKDLRKLQSFVEINATGFRKILKKWDKRSKSTTKELYLARQVDVQPVFNREFIAELSDVAAANILELENLLIAGRTDGWDASVDRPRDPKADGIASDRISFGVAPTHRRDVQGDVEMDVIEYDEFETNLLKAVEASDRELVNELLNSLPVPADPAEQTPEVRGRLARILWRAALGAADLEPSDIRTTPKEAAVDSKMTIMTPSTALSETEVIPSSRLDFTFVDDINGRSCLHEAAGAGRVRLVQLCVDHDVAVSSADVYGRRPLHYAAMNGHSAVCSLLLDNGADASAVDHDGFSPLMYAVTRGKANCVRTLLDHGVTLAPTSQADMIPLSLACQYGHYEIALLMLQRGAQIVADQEGMWPQHLAAREGHAAVLRLLVEAGADVDQPDKYSLWTPLFHAASEGHAPCVRVLLEARCDIQPLDDVRKPPIHYAAWQGHIDCVNLLLSAGGAGRKPGAAGAVAGTSIGSSSAKSVAASEALKSGSITTGSSVEPDLMDLEGDMIPSLSLPPPIIPFRIYGHTYLDKKALVQLVLGHPNTSKSSPPPIRLYGQPELSSLKLVMSGHPDSVALSHSTILPLEDEREVFSFHVDSFDQFSLDFEIFPTFGTKIMGKAVALPSTFADLRHQAAYILPILDGHLRLIGEVSFEINVVKPFEGVQLSMGGRMQTYWKATANMNATTLGADAPASAPASQPNASVVTASSLSGEYVRIIVQVTSDGVPITYPVWSFPIGGIEMAVGDMTYAQIHDVASRADRLVNLVELAEAGPSVETWSATIAKGVVALKDLLEVLPVAIGVNLEIRYPTRSDAARLRLRNALPLNDFVDAVLAAMYRSSQIESQGGTRERRRFVLSSFNPVVCTALNWKQPNYAVFFASYCGLSRSSSEGKMLPANRTEDDRRCISLREATRFARANNLLGVMLDATILLQVPSLVQSTKEHGLLLTTFGSESPETLSYGADGHMRTGVLQYASREFIDAVEA